MSAKTPSVKASSPEKDDKNGKFNQDQTRTVVDTEIGACWERLNHHHQAAGDAFLHTVICGVEIVKLKLAIRHGSFAEEVQKHVQKIAPRTIRRYRQIGEWYLSAAHQRVMTVMALRENDAEPQDNECSDEAVTNYLETTQVKNADELQQHALEKVPDLAKPRAKSKGSRAENLMQKVKRYWSRMSSEQKIDFVKRFEEFRSQASKTNRPPSATVCSDNPESYAQGNLSETAATPAA
jgi:hypothetical protein